jgi:hypothetical protein
MYVLADGDGNYDGSALTGLTNPMRRDVQNLRPQGHIVVQVDTTNTGIWPFHCHIAWHASAGFFAQFLFNSDGFAALSIPDSLTQTCNEWDAFTSVEVPNQIDSGL